MRDGVVKVFEVHVALVVVKVVRARPVARTKVTRVDWDPADCVAETAFGWRGKVEPDDFSLVLGGQAAPIEGRRLGECASRVACGLRVNALLGNLELWG